jgi:hypothetical protein
LKQTFSETLKKIEQNFRRKKLEKKLRTNLGEKISERKNLEAKLNTQFGRKN